MFRIQKLEITGFKSFADYTEIIFTGDGITAVVGPNGCGKSNVSEAISWVLGEQSAKNLRGGEMRDVIFQGAKNRQPSGMAEVVLHLIRDDKFVAMDETDDIDHALAEFDEKSAAIEHQENISAFASNGKHTGISNGSNGFHQNGNNYSYNYADTETITREVVGVQETSSTSGKRKWRTARLSIDFAPGEAVAITRRLYRSGESEYLLNGRVCRLRDIQDLFSGTGLSGAHYAIIEQGRIGQILSAKPSDRRALIEEAAGITKFRVRQRAAEVRLESAKNNLRRLSDIVSEVEKHTNSLRRQAAKTRRYKLLREEWRELLQQVFAGEYISLNSVLESLQKDIAFVTEKEQKQGSEIESLENLAQAAKQNARQAEEELSELRRMIAERALQKERQQGEMKFQTQQISNLTQQLALLKRDIETTQEKLQLSAQDIKRLQEKNEKARLENDANNSILKIEEEKYQDCVRQVRRIESEMEKERGLLVQHSTAVERFREILRQSDATSEKIGERRNGLERETIRANQNFQENNLLRENLETEVIRLRQSLSEIKELQQFQLQSLQSQKEVVKFSENNWRKTREELSKNQNRLETLREIEVKNTLYAPAVQKLFAAQTQLNVQLHGTLADRLRVRPEFEMLVETVFSTKLQAILVDSIKSVEKISVWLNEKKIGRVDLLIWNPNEFPSAKVSFQANEIGGFLEIEENSLAYLSEVYPEQMKACVIRNLSEAQNFPNQTCVTENGEIIERQRLYKIGQASANSQNSNLLAFKRELRELATRSEELQQFVDAAEISLRTEKEKLADFEQKLTQINQNLNATDRDLMQKELNAKSLAQEIERSERHLRVVEDEKRRLGIEAEEAQKRAEKTSADLQTAEKAKLAANKNIEQTAISLNDWRRQAETQNSKLSNKRSEAATAQERRRSLANALRRSESEQVELNQKLNKSETDLQAANKQLIVAQNTFNALQKTFVSINITKTDENEEIQKSVQKLHSARQSEDQLTQQLTNLNKLLTDNREARSNLLVRQAETLTRLENLQTQCLQELNTQIELLATKTLFEMDFDLSQKRNQLEELREKLDNFGAVNMLALDELSESEERFVFLTKQRQDIVDGLNSADEALREIKNRSRQRFQMAFGEINRNFSVFFQQIFGGGRGEMNLLEAEDILEAGIEIVAQPPGKRLQNILLLSGGEKAMTAIALVLAIFKYRPSPFCLLDEVDAPLDEANVGRFVEQIEQMSEKTQFIVITHNKRTMESARALYGVTMEQAGISKIVSVKFQ